MVLWTVLFLSLCIWSVCFCRRLAWIMYPLWHWRYLVLNEGDEIELLRETARCPAQRYMHHSSCCCCAAKPRMNQGRWMVGRASVVEPSASLNKRLCQCFSSLFARCLSACRPVAPSTARNRTRSAGREDRRPRRPSGAPTRAGRPLKAQALASLPSPQWEHRAGIQRAGRRSEAS